MKVMELARAARFEAVISPFILEELKRNLLQKTGWDPVRFAALHKSLKTHFLLVRPKTRLRIIRRVDADNRILECALDSGASVLVTGNMKDIRPLGVFRGIEILTPREFLQKYFPESAD